VVEAEEKPGSSTGAHGNMAKAAAEKERRQKNPPEESPAVASRGRINRLDRQTGTRY
jgi:hypothetical protein